MHRVLSKGYARTLLVQPGEEHLDVEVTNPLIHLKRIFMVDMVQLACSSRLLEFDAGNLTYPTLFGISLFMVEGNSGRWILKALSQTLAPSFTVK